MRLTILLAVMVIGLIATPHARAEIVQLQAEMDGLQSVPPTASQGTGIALFELDTQSGILTFVSGSYQNLIGNIMMAHVHGFAVPGQTSGVLFMLQHTGGTSGTLSLMNNQIQLKDGDVQGMLAGLTYVSLHTDIFTAGEIRGQIYQVPAPAGLMMLGVAALAARRRRR